MAVKVSQSGGIYIEISGDYSQFEQDLKVVREMGKSAGKAISDAMSGAIDPKGAARMAEKFTTTLDRARRSAEAMKADLSGTTAQFEWMGRAIGVAEKDLGRFVQMQERAFRTRAGKELEAGLRELQRQTGMTDKEMNALAGSLGAADLQFGKTAKSVKGICLDMKALLVEGVKLAAAKKIWDGFNASFDLGARYETLGVVVRQVGQLSGQSAVQVDANVNALRRMGIAGVEARKTLTQLMQAQVDVAKAPALARIAQDAAVIGGVNSSQAFETMVHGIQSAQVEVLRNIGINVNFEQAYAKLAAQLGKTTGELTEQEKVQARVNAVMDAGVKIAGSYEGAMTTLGKQMSSLDRVQQDLGTDAGKFLLEMGKATGGITLYQRALEGLNADMLAARGKLAGVGAGEIQKAHDAGGLSAVRELVEGAETAREEIARLEAQIDALGKRGLNFDSYRAEIDKAKENFIEARDEVVRLEQRIEMFERRGLDTSGMIAQVEALKQKFIEGAEGVLLMRMKMQEMAAWARGLAAAPAADAPATLFVFKPYQPGSGVAPDIREIEKEMQRLRDEYGKTAAGAKSAKSSLLAENKEMLKVLVEQGHLAREEADKMLAAFTAEEGKLNKSGGAAAISKRAAAVKALNEETARLTMTEKDYAAFQASQKEAEWRKTGVPEEDIARWRQALDAVGGKKQFAEAQGALKDLEKEYQNTMKRLVGLESSITAEMDKFRDAAKVAFAAGTLSAEEYAGVLGRIAELEREKLVQSSRRAEDGMTRAFRNYARDATDMAKGIEDAVVGGFSGMEDALASFVRTAKLDFSDLANSILSDMARIFSRQAIGGLAGMAGNWLGSMIGGGSGGVDWSNTSWDNFGGLSHSAHGNVFPAGTSLGDYRNSIVTRPTAFAFAHGGAPNLGIMGEAPGSPGEVIAPLFRASNGDVGVKASASAVVVQPVVNVYNETGAQVTTRSGTDQNGQPRLDVLIREVDSGMANMAARGQSEFANVIGRQNGLNRDAALYRR